MADRHDILADRLNAEPAIFKGCSSSELGVIVGVAVMVWLPVSLLLAGLMGAVTMGFGIAGVIGVLCIMASLFLTGLQRVVIASLDFDVLRIMTLLGYMRNVSKSTVAGALSRGRDLNSGPFRWARTLSPAAPPTASTHG